MSDLFITGLFIVAVGTMVYFWCSLIKSIPEKSFEEKRLDYLWKIYKSKQGVQS